MNALHDLHMRKIAGTGKGFDPALALARLFELREVAVDVAKLGNHALPAQLDQKDICDALEIASHGVQALFNRHVTSMLGFMEAGLKAIEFARAADRFNQAAAGRLFEEYIAAEKSVLGLINR